MSGHAEARAVDLSAPAPLDAQLDLRLKAMDSTLAALVESAAKRALLQRVSASDATASCVRVQDFDALSAKSPWWCIANIDGCPLPAAIAIANGSLLKSIDLALGGNGKCEINQDRPSTVSKAVGEDLTLKFCRQILSKVESLPLGLKLAPAKLAGSSIALAIDDPTAAYLSLRLNLGEKEDEKEEEKEQEKNQFAAWLLFPMVALPVEKPSPPKPAEEMRLGPLADRQASIDVELTRCRLPLEEVRALAKGDVIVFDETPGAPTKVLVAGIPRFEARLGAYRGRYAVEITKALEEAEDESRD